MSKRARVLMAIMGILGVIFIGRLFYLQIVMHSHYQAEAIKEHISKFIIPAKRGLIYVHDGKDAYVPLVMNEPVYTVFADPRYVREPEQIIESLKRIAGANLAGSVADSLADTTRQYVVLARDLNKQQARLLEQENLRGIGLQEHEKRVYPEGKLAAHVLGFVNNEGQGQYGIEQGLQEDLAGRDGQLNATTDVYGIPLSIGPESVQDAPIDGKNIVLSIDRTIQHKVEELLASGLKRANATKGSALVMDPRNGQILAMANMPTYNPEKFSDVSDYGVFHNGVVSDPYESGSVFKALTMGVGLESGAIVPHSVYNNTGSMQVDDAVIKNVLNEPRGIVDMTQVLAYSFNTGMVWLLQQLGGGSITHGAKQRLHDFFTQNYYFGELTGIELANEARGHVAPPSASNVQYANMTFGQGITTTMLQVAAAFSASINGGTYYTPQVVGGYLQDDKFEPVSPHIRKHNVLSSQNSANLRSMLHQARVGSPVALGEKPGYVTGGKTGTSQVYNHETGKYDEKATIGSYIGFGGQDTPEYVIMVRIDDANVAGYSGSVAAAPVFTDISNWLVEYLQIPPKGQ